MPNDTPPPSRPDDRAIPLSEATVPDDPTGAVDAPDTAGDIHASAVTPEQAGERTGDGVPSPRRAVRLSPLARRDAALCYLFPFIPGIVVLFRDRQRRYVRFHAAQSVVYFALIALAQVALYVAFIAVGTAIDDAPAATAWLIVFLLGFGAIGVVALLTWLRLIAEAYGGRGRPLPLLTSWAFTLEGATRAMQRPHTRRAPSGPTEDVQNTATR